MIKFLFATFFLFVGPHLSRACTYDTSSISDTLTYCLGRGVDNCPKDLPYTKLCEGDIQVLNGVMPPADLYYIDGVDCQVRIRGERRLNFINVIGSGVVSFSTTGQYLGITYQAVQSEKIIISSKVQYKFGNYSGSCPSVFEQETIIYGTVDFKVIKKPEPPKILVERPVIKVGQQTTLFFEGCPNSLHNFDSLNSYSAPQFITGCNESGTPDFTQGSYAESGFTFYRRENPGTEIFYARCNDNGCFSNTYTKTRIVTQFKGPDCGDPKMDEIDAYTRAEGKGYHHFSQETVICSVVDGNPNCTVNNVFSLMKSRKDYNVFIASELFDFPGLRPAIPAVQFIGSDLVFKIDSTPVSNCEPFNLAGPISIASNLTTLAVFTGIAGKNGLNLYSFIQPYSPTQSTLIPAANPIAQYIDEPSHSVTNYTKLGHVFYPGKIVRTVIEECGQIKVITTGVGRHFFADMGPSLYPFFLNATQSMVDLMAQLMGSLNSEAGPILFKNVDERLKQGFYKQPR